MARGGVSLPRVSRLREENYLFKLGSFWDAEHVQRCCCLQVTPRLDSHPAMITVLEMGAARHFLRMQQLAKTSEERAQILQPTLEINAGYGKEVIWGTEANFEGMS